MFFQRVLKGIHGLTSTAADAAFREGLLCNWWRNVQTITPETTILKLTARNLDWHLNHYDTPDPFTGNAPFCQNTPFISVTAGVVERDAFARQNIVFDPFMTALQFATNNFALSGHIFYAYVFTLGRQSLHLKEFSEEVRELNIYRHFLPFHREGEITAKIEIRGPCIEKWEEYDGRQVLADWAANRTPQPITQRNNPGYAPPERYCNIRGLVTA
jgi:hypothetical protein